MRTRFFALGFVVLYSLTGCAGATSPSPRSAADLSPQAQADELLAFYNPIYVALYTESARAAWLASTDVTEEHTGMRTGADTAFAAFGGNAEVIRRARASRTRIGTRCADGAAVTADALSRGVR